MRCYEDSLTWKKLLLRKQKVNRDINDVCSSKTIRIAYNTYPRFFELNENSTMKVYPYYWSYGYVRAVEVLTSFLASLNLKPVWTDCYGVWGTVDKRFGNWSGAVAEVDKMLVVVIGLLLHVFVFSFTRLILPHSDPADHLI